MIHFTPLAWVLFLLVIGMPLLEPAASVSADDNMMHGKALYEDVVKYAGFAPHMTGTKGDLATSRWMADELKSAGLTSELQPWKLNQFNLQACELTIKDIKIEAFPFWYPKSTGPGPVEAPLVVMTKETKPDDLKGKIVFISSKITGVAIYNQGINKLAAEAREAGAVGLAAAVGNLAGELTAINAVEPYHQSPLPLPGVIIAIKDQALVEAAAQAGQAASLLIDGRDIPQAEASNIIGTLKRGPKWIVVTTPTSGWFECAGERGPGVALFLALARWAARNDSPFSFMFLGNSGHELDNIGAHHTLDKYAPPVKDVACWIHLGASIAVRSWKKTGQGFEPLPEVFGNLNLVWTEALMPILQKAFEGVPGYKPRSQGQVAGELSHFIKAGYPAFGFFGGHLYFHTRYDTPKTTDPAFLEPVGRALIQVIRAVEQTSARE